MNFCLLDAAYNVVHDYPGGSASLAPRMGKGVSSLSHEVTGTGTAKLGLVDAEKITQLTGDLRILQAFAGNCSMMLVPFPAAVDDADGPVSANAMKRISETAQEFAQLCAAVSGSVADGHVTPNELSAIDRECGELIASLYLLRKAASKMNGGAR